jgi:hypothetical protein
MPSVVASSISTCIFLFALLGCNPTSQEQQLPESNLSFGEHIGPIIYRECLPCHHQGGDAPFALDSYEKVRKKAKTIQKVTQLRYMPPWPADVNYSHFLDEKYLSSEEIKAIATWVEEGCTIGDTSNLVLPKYELGSNLGKPDLVLKMAKPIRIKANNEDAFYLLKLPFDLPKDTFIQTLEIVAGAKGIVHHVNAHLLKYEDAKKKNVFEGAEVIINNEKGSDASSYEMLKVPQDDGTYPTMVQSVGNYLPGVKAVEYPQDIGGYYLPKKGAILFNNIHYGPSGKEVLDATYVNIFYRKTPPSRPLKELILGTLGKSEIQPPLIIPPGKKTHHTTRFKAQENMSMLTINPHMHLIGKRYLAYVLKQNGDTIPLIHIPNWDFRWQYFYTFKQPVCVEKGDEIVAEAWYDNTAQNINNPYNPPQLIRDQEGSMRSTDEMFQLIITYMAYKPRDESIDLGKLE